MKNSRIVILVSVCFAIQALIVGLDYNSSNFVPVQRKLSREAVEKKWTIQEYRSALSQYPKISIWKDHIPSNEVVSSAEVPLRLFSTSASVTVIFENGVAVKALEEEFTAAM